MDGVVVVHVDDERVPPRHLKGRRGQLPIDAEDGDSSEITLNNYALQKYKETVSSFIGSIKTFCAKRSITYLPVRTETPVETIVTKYLRERGVVR